MSAQLAMTRPLQPAGNRATKRPMLRLLIPPVRPAIATDVPADEITELAEALREDDGLGILEAMCHSVEMLDDLDVYAAAWDSMAFLAGNRAAILF